MKEMIGLETRCIGKNWRDEYQRKLVSAEEAVKTVKSGDRVVFPTASLPRLLGATLAASEPRSSLPLPTRISG